jgi:hypothetical protein
MASSSKKQTNYKLKKKRYNCLGDVRTEIESSGKEKVKEFIGHTLTTDTNTYTMFDSIVYVNGVAHGID